MDKVTTETVKFNRLKHNFYCDECGEFLGSAVECEDGYYPDPKELVELKIYISSWLTYQKHLCQKCRHKKIRELTAFLHDFGFRADGEDQDGS